jgi:hypothetical protein
MFRGTELVSICYPISPLDYVNIKGTIDLAALLAPSTILTALSVNPEMTFVRPPPV